MPLTANERRDSAGIYVGVSETLRPRQILIVDYAHWGSQEVAIGDLAQDPALEQALCAFHFGIVADTSS